MNSTYNFGFILEQTLGHVTHSKNLQATICEDSSVHAAIAPIKFESSDFSSKVPLLSNWTVRAGMQARRAVSQMNSDTSLDALFVHTQVPAILMTNWIKQIPTVVSMDATPLQYDQLAEYYSHKVGNPLLEQMKRRASRSCFHHAARIVTWSKWVKTGLIEGYEVPAEKIVVIPPGINMEEWSMPIAERTQTGPLKILFVGGDLERKGGLDLIEAFRSLRKTAAEQNSSQQPELHLVTRDHVEQEAGIFVYNNIKPNSTKLKELFQQSHIFCLPTYGDTLGLAILEAAAVNLPIISTKIAAIPEVVDDGETGILITPGDVTALTSALRTLMEDAPLRASMGNKAGAWIRQEYDSQKNTVKLLDLLKDISLDPAGKSEANSPHIKEPVVSIGKY